MIKEGFHKDMAPEVNIRVKVIEVKERARERLSPWETIEIVHYGRVIDCKG